MLFITCMCGFRSSISSSQGRIASSSFGFGAILPWHRIGLVQFCSFFLFGCSLLVHVSQRCTITIAAIFSLTQFSFYCRFFFGAVFFFGVVFSLVHFTSWCTILFGVLSLLLQFSLWHKFLLVQNFLWCCFFLGAEFFFQAVPAPYDDN